MGKTSTGPEKRIVGIVETKKKMLHTAIITREVQLLIFHTHAVPTAIVSDHLIPFNMFNFIPWLKNRQLQDREVL